MNNNNNKAWYKRIDWAGIAKTITALATACGIGVGVTASSGMVESPAYEGLEGRFNIFQVTDSMRNVYMERRLSKMEADIQTIMTLNRETHDVVIRLEARGEK